MYNNINEDNNLNLVQNIETEALLNAIYQRYGYDFRDYNKAHVKRRILHRVAHTGLKSISQLMHKVLHEDQFFDLILRDLSINVTEMYRDPSFYAVMRKEVIPILKTYPT